MLLVLKLPPPPQAYMTVAGLCISCILEMRTLRHREVRPLVKGHRARTWQDRGPSGPPGPKVSPHGLVFCCISGWSLLSLSLCCWQPRVPGLSVEIALGLASGEGSAPSLGGSDAMLSLEREPWQPSTEKQRQHFANKQPYSQSYGYSSSHVRKWELNHEEGWAPKNWCFWTMVLEKTLGLQGDPTSQS